MSGFSIGDTVVITDQDGHFFRKGLIVRIVDLRQPSLLYQCRSERGNFQWISEHQLATPTSVVGKKTIQETKE